MVRVRSGSDVGVGGGVESKVIEMRAERERRVGGESRLARATH